MFHDKGMPSPTPNLGTVALSEEHLLSSRHFLIKTDLHEDKGVIKYLQILLFGFIVTNHKQEPCKVFTFFVKLKRNKNIL